jgi:hypothetical protein
VSVTDETPHGHDASVRYEEDHDLLTFAERGIRLRKEVALTEAALQEYPAPEQRAVLSGSVAPTGDVPSTAAGDPGVAVPEQLFARKYTGGEFLPHGRHAAPAHSGQARELGLSQTRGAVTRVTAGDRGSLFISSHQPHHPVAKQ